MSSNTLAPLPPRVTQFNPNVEPLMYLVNVDGLYSLPHIHIPQSNSELNLVVVCESCNHSLSAFGPHPRLMERINDLAKYDEDWNDDGAMAPDQNSIALMKRFVNDLYQTASGNPALNVLPQVDLTHSGGIRLRWSKDGVVVRIIASPDNREVACIVDREGHNPVRTSGPRHAINRILQLVS